MTINRELEYFGWSGRNVLQSTPGYYLVNSGIYTIAKSTSGILYCGGYASFQGGVGYSNAVIFRSEDDGLNWYLVYKQSDTQESAINKILCTGSIVYAICQDRTLTSGYTWVVLKSTTGNSGTFEFIDTHKPTTSEFLPLNGCLGPSGSVYVCGYEKFNNKYTALLRKSTDGSSGSFISVDSVLRDPAQSNTSNTYRSVCVSKNGSVYVVGNEQVHTPDQSTNAIVRKSTTGNSGTFSYVDNVHSGSVDLAWGVASYNNNVYVVGDSQYTNAKRWWVRRSVSGSSGSFEECDTFGIVTGSVYNTPSDVAIDSNGVVYVAGNDNNTGGGGSSTWYVRRSTTGLSGTFYVVDRDGEKQYNIAGKMFIDDQNKIYVIGRKDTTRAVMRVGKYSQNKYSIGPSMMATSVGYVLTESLNSSNFYQTQERFLLNNVSEFPHSMGIFQMKNMILGTQTSGKVGKSEDSLIRINHIGSVVRILWPKQESTNKNYIYGYGDFSAGQRAGQLSVNFVPGEFYNVSEDNYDHLSLYCYLQKEEIGTYDEVVIRIERRPLTSVPFVVDNAITYQASGSYTTEAVLTDLVYTKPVDYSDLSIREIGFPIDVPLVNTKEIRVSCKIKNGQSEKNNNFIVYGRFVKKEITSNET